MSIYEIDLPESGKTHPLKSLTRKQLKALETEAQKLPLREYQDRVLTEAYPDLYQGATGLDEAPALDQLDDLPGADIAHIVSVTLSYSMGGPESVKNSLRSGGGTGNA